MTEERHERPRPDPADSDLSRRAFVALSIGSGLAAATRSAGAALPVVESDLAIETPDGSCDAAFIHPASGVHPGVLIWPDAFGLRPAMREMGRRLAGEGFAVLVPNPFYRLAKAPLYETAANVDFSAPETRAKLGPLMGSINAPGAAEKMPRSMSPSSTPSGRSIAARRIGTQGYCMGGALGDADGRGSAGSDRRRRVVPRRRAGHRQADSPHLLAPRIRARMYIGVAANDDQRQPEAKDKLRAAFAAGNVPAEIEVYPARHGWCVPDMPTEAGAPIYSAADAERAWGKLLALYRSALA
jgi:carboxymethylenebutenolidase